MSLISKLKDAIVPQTERGIRYRCTNCDNGFEEAREHCPECGSTEIKEEEGFEFRPQE